jgi:tetratricopeptide (TPR) repeat protein
LKKCTFHADCDVVTPLPPQQDDGRDGPLGPPPPHYSTYHSNRGRTYNAKKEYDRAILDLNQSIRLDPANPLPYWNRAISYENKLERDRALVDWRTTLRLDPANQDAIKAIRRLEQEKAAPGAVQQNRVALVIGNADHRYAGRLANPINDANDFANVIRTLGFEVIEGSNLDKRGMDEKITEFSRKLDNATIGLFFYAGHGIQIDGDNYLIPIDARIQRRPAARTLRRPQERQCQHCSGAFEDGGRTARQPGLSRCVP